MTHDEMVALIRGAVQGPGDIWADLGAGDGSFTRALHDLLGADAMIYAVDKDRCALDRLKRRWPPASGSLRVMAADFTQPLDLPLLDGILVANALHFIPDQEAVLRRIAGYLREGGRLAVVEYDLDAPLRYIPRPLPFSRLRQLAEAAGFTAIRQTAVRRSPRTGISMYCGRAER